MVGSSFDTLLDRIDLFFVADEIEGFAVEDEVDPGILVVDVGAGWEVAKDEPEVGDEIT